MPTPISDEPVGSIRGIGPKYQRCLDLIGVVSVGDLLKRIEQDGVQRVATDSNIPISTLNRVYKRIKSEHGSGILVGRRGSAFRTFIVPTVVGWLGQATVLYVAGLGIDPRNWLPLLIIPISAAVVVLALFRLGRRLESATVRITVKSLCFVPLLVAMVLEARIILGPISGLSRPTIAFLVPPRDEASLTSVRLHEALQDLPFKARLERLGISYRMQSVVLRQVPLRESLIGRYLLSRPNVLLLVAAIPVGSEVIVTTYGPRATRFQSVGINYIETSNYRTWDEWTGEMMALPARQVRLRINALTIQLDILIRALNR